MNNAGIGIAGPIEWTPLEHMKHIADVNLWGMIDVTKTFLPLIKKSQGRVVNLSSMAGEFTGVMGTLTEKKCGNNIILYISFVPVYHLLCFL